MTDKYKFKHELPKDESNIYGKVSSPLCLTDLLTELLQINESEGKIVYDGDDEGEIMVMEAMLLMEVKLWW